MKINLTAAQKGLVQLLESLLLTAFMAGIVSMTPVLDGSGAINVQVAATSFGIAFLFSLGHGIFAYAKYLPAPVAPDGQPQVTPTQVGAQLDSLLTEIERRVGFVGTSATASPAPAQPAAVQVQQPVSAPAAAPQSQLVPPDTTSMPVVTPPQG